MYRVLTILALILALTAAEIGLMDGFFGKPRNKESLALFRNNSERSPHRFHDVVGRDQPSRRPKRKVEDYLYWDSPDSLASKWFSADDKDFCRATKAVIIVFAVIGFAGLFVLIMWFCRRRLAYSESGYSEMDCRSSGCMCGQNSV